MNLLFKFITIAQLFYTTQASNEFKTVESHENGVGGPSKSYLACQFDNEVVDNEFSVINTDGNQNPNSEVQMVLYHERNTMSVIPNNIFETFPNLEYLWIGNDQKCENFKPEYLKGALCLKTLRMSKNLMTKVIANAYVEAPNLENINLQHNKIEFIHVFAFNGLSKLEGVYLMGNDIKELHPLTFSWLNHIVKIDLVNCNCIDKEYQIDYQNFGQLESDIATSCLYPHTADLKNFKAKDPIADFMLNSLNQNLADLLQNEQQKSKDLGMQLQSSEAKCTNKIENLSKSFQEQINLMMENVQTLLSQKVHTINQNFQNHENACQLKFQELYSTIQNNQQSQSQTNDASAQNLKNLEETTKTSNNNLAREIQGVKNSIDSQHNVINALKETTDNAVKNMSHLLHACETSNNLKIQNLATFNQEKLAELANSIKLAQEQQTQHLNESLSGMSHQIHQFGAICETSKSHATSNFGELKKLQNKLVEIDEQIENLTTKTQENEKILKEKFGKGEHGSHGSHGQHRDSDVKSLIF